MNYRYIDEMDGHEFEYFCANILRAQGYENISVTRGSGDQGVDIIAEREGIKYAIQCKRYSQPVGNKAVQEIYAGKAFYHCHIGIIMTNNYFTASAKELAKENGIVLWDREYLKKYISSYQKIENVADNKEVEYLNISHGIVHLINNDLSKELFEYFKCVSRARIDLYLQSENENAYINEMRECVMQPIQFYNAKYHTYLKHIKYIFYGKMDPKFKESQAYQLFSSKGNYNDDLFEIDVFFRLDDFALCNTKIKFKKVPEVDISTTTMENMELLENIEKYNDEEYVTPSSFFLKKDNILLQDKNHSNSKMENPETEQRNFRAEISSNQELPCENDSINMNDSQSWSTTGSVPQRGQVSNENIKRKESWADVLKENKVRDEKKKFQMRFSVLSGFIGVLISLFILYAVLDSEEGFGGNINQVISATLIGVAGITNIIGIRKIILQYFSLIVYIICVLQFILMSVYRLYNPMAIIIPSILLILTMTDVIRAAKKTEG